jgi:class 3 adenylate cyclase/DNA polymerase III delta prime subunit
MATARTVTVMFTDLVDSTAMSSQLDAAGADRLRDSHFGLLRGAIDTYDGREVKNLGDGVMAVFDSTIGALSAAEEIQRAAHLHSRSPDKPPLAIRVGLSLGEVVEEDGDVFGDAVVEAARLCARADGGQILATQLIALTAGRRATQELRPLGPVELKGFAEPVDIVEVGWATPPVTEAGEGQVPLPARCLTAPEVGLIGRQREFDDLTTALKHAKEGARQLALLGGEPGIGKTTVACAVARHAYEEGATVLFGRADEDLGLPYQPWVEALQHLLDHLPGPLAASVELHRSSLDRILPTAGDPDPSTRVDADAESARYALYEAVREVVAVAAAHTPVVILLDDIQWADAPSLALLRHLVSTMESDRVMVIGTFRESEVTADHPLADLLAWLHRESGVTRISLRGLDDVELLALMEAASGQNMDADGLSLRDALLAETDGNPFFITELLRHLVETQAVYQQGDRWVASVDLRTSGLPVSVQEVVGRRVKRLGPATAEMLAAAAVIGPEFDLATLTAITSAQDEAVLDVVESACEARLITELGPEHYRFAHALVEHSLYDSISPTRRARLHRRIAELIEADQQHRLDRVGELANHWSKATAPADSAKAIEYAVLAGERALDRLAPDEALRWYTQAQDLLASGSAPDDHERVRVLVGLGDAQRQVGSPAYRGTLLEAAHLAQRIGDADLLVRAALLNNRGFISSVGLAVDRDRVEVIESALKAVHDADSTERARLLALLSAELIYVSGTDDQRDRVEAAIDMARRLGDPRTFAAVVTTGYLAIAMPDTLAHRHALTDEALAAANSCADVVMQFWATNFKAFTLYQAGEVEAAHALQEGMADRIGQPILRWVQSYAEATHHVVTGDLDIAEAQATAAHQIGESTGQPDISLYYLAQFGQLAMLRGDVEAIIDVLVQSTRDYPHIKAINACLARSLCILGRHDEAALVLRPLVDGTALNLHEDLQWLGTVILCAEVVSELDLRDSAAVLYDALAPYAGQLDYTGVQSWGSPSEALARLAALQGLASAGRYFTQAIALYERMGAAYFLARTQIYYGQWLMSLPSESDRAAGLEHLATGSATARERGYALLERLAAS